MTTFQLKQLASAALHGAPKGVRWNYDRAEIMVDAVIHSLGVIGGVIAAVSLIVVTSLAATGTEIVAVSVYVGGLVIMLTISAVYNLWPVSRARWVLRRFDHSAIYVLIAATYTPFIVEMPVSATSVGLLAGVWTIAAVGIVLKLVLPGRLDKLSIALYLAMGWSGAMVFNTLVTTLPPLVLWLIAAGGLLYSFGVIFHVWERLRFQNAIWHGFVLLGASCHYSAVLSLVLA
jgi:hemolysin III